MRKLLLTHHADHKLNVCLWKDSKYILKIYIKFATTNRGEIPTDFRSLFWNNFIKYAEL
jgi:hypothetical protein